MEYIDVVNEKDEVVGRAAETDIYEQGLSHRITHVFLSNPAGELALQLRSATDSFCPSHWSTSIAGHVQEGETYEMAAAREMREEAGVHAPIRWLGKEAYDVPGRDKFKKFLGVFATTYEGAFTMSEEEGGVLAFFPQTEIDAMIERGEKFHPELLFLLKKGYHRL